jgi:hypothetical protein
MRLAMKLGPFLSRPEMSEQRVQLILNGQQVETLVLKEEKANEYRLLLPKHLLREKNVLTFRLPDASSPRASGKGEDPRQLGIAMYWMQLQPHANAGQNSAGQ